MKKRSKVVEKAVCFFFIFLISLLSFFCINCKESEEEEEEENEDFEDDDEDEDDGRPAKKKIKFSGSVSKIETTTKENKRKLEVFWLLNFFCKVDSTGLTISAKKRDSRIREEKKIFFS